MKSLKDIIIEKLKLNKDSKSNKIKELESADKIINNWKELNQLDNNIFDNNILSFIHSYIKEYPLYIWIYDENHLKKVEEINNIIKQYRIDNNIDASIIRKMNPQSIGGNNAYCIVLFDKDTKYTEIYIKSKNLNPNKLYFILQEQ